MKITKLKFLLLFLLPAGALLAAEGPSEKSIMDVLSYKEVVNVQLSFDLEALMADRATDEKHAAQLSFKDENGNVQDWDLKVNVRGKFRRVKCNELPPLKLNFKKKDLEAAGLATYDDFKLVTYCVDDYNMAKELLLKEYLVYKMYNELTEQSFRVQLLNITYKDSKTGSKKRQMGFLIEDAAQLRARINADKSEVVRATEEERFNPEITRMVALFEYMIGNADWEITYSKNVKYVTKNDILVPIPYDFDFSGLVGASYATYSQRQYGQLKLQDRVYLGFERSTSDLKATMAYFEEKKDDLYRVIYSFKRLNPDTRDQMVRYLETFFKNNNNLTFAPVRSTVANAAP
ncbi:MAG: hypothetical protein R2824_17850 [Saprospiraceae bacterium]|nr:hypothetical protein [Lewinella sp.]